MEINTKEKILIQAEQLFMRLGVRSVSMDDVARELAMSKKTLYQFFENKDNLVNEVVENHLKTESLEFTTISENSINAIDELYQISICIKKNFSNTNPSTLHDLQKYHPEGWQKFLYFKESVIRKQVENNLVRGIEEGFYRQDIDVAIISKLRLEMVQICFDHRVFPADRYEIARVQLQSFDLFTYGLLSEKGRIEFYKYLNQTQSHLT